MLELIPQMREPERFVPVIGWFYAAPLKPLVLEWENQFNILSVTGETGAGKTLTLRTMWQLFGMNGEPMSADATNFVIDATLASSQSVPMWFDEYKPSDMNERDVDQFLNKVRKSTSDATTQRGNVDQSSNDFRLVAPVVVSGEERIQGSAEERRGIFTSFKKLATLPGTDTRDAFIALREWDDFDQHTLAYIQFLLAQDPDELRALWDDCEDDVKDHLAENNVELAEDLVVQGLQTIKFGTTLFRAFCDHIGIDADDVLPPADDYAGIDYVATESTGGANRESHAETFFSVATHAAGEGYLAQGEHYRFVREGQENEELRIHLGRSFGRVKKYAREHDVSSDLLNSKGGLDDRLRDGEETIVWLATRCQQTAGLGSSVGIDVEIAEREIDDFERHQWDESANGPERTFIPLADDHTRGRVDLTVEVTHAERGEDIPMVESGTLTDETATVDYVVWDEDVPELGSDECYLIKGAKFDEYDGAPQVVVD